VCFIPDGRNERQAKPAPNLASAAQHRPAAPTAPPEPAPQSCPSFFSDRPALKRFHRQCLTILRGRGRIRRRPGRWTSRAAGGRGGAGDRPQCHRERRSSPVSLHTPGLQVALDRGSGLPAQGPELQSAADRTTYRPALRLSNTNPRPPCRTGAAPTLARGPPGVPQAGPGAPPDAGGGARWRFSGVPQGRWGGSRRDSTAPGGPGRGGCRAPLAGRGLPPTPARRARAARSRPRRGSRPR